MGLLLAAVAQPSACQPDSETPPIVVVLDDKFEAMNLTYPESYPLDVLGKSKARWVFAREFKDDKDASGFILQVAHAQPVVTPKAKKFDSGIKTWNEVAVRYPFRLGYRRPGRTTDQPILKGELRGQVSQLKGTDLVSPTKRFELRIVSVDQLIKEATEPLLTKGLNVQLRSNVIPLIATPDRRIPEPSVVAHTVRRSTPNAIVSVAMKNRLPVRVTGALRCTWAKEPGPFELNPGAATTVQLTPDDPKGKVPLRVYLRQVRLEPPAAKDDR
ncbi:MAG: hypothetical protein U0736_04390 [Gemmataceae bacterium]